jgi:DNA/RNA-binding domain of Phe-tRNA-synthetase-like protein
MPTLAITATDDWRMAHPGAVIGLLEVTGIYNSGSSPVLDDHKRAVEARLRERYHGFTRPDFLALPVLAAYDRYYKRFDKTYHVQLQLESIVLKGKNLPSVSPLVDANFVAEVKTLVLTVGHDVRQLQEPVIVDVAQSGDQMTQMNGTSKTIRAGDMIMRDAGGISCTILYGQDNRSPISAATSHVLYVAYAPVGVGAAAVEAQLRGIEANIRHFAPAAAVEQLRTIAA